MIKVLVTGGAGFIGSNFGAMRGGASGPAVTTLDELTYAAPRESARFARRSAAHLRQGRHRRCGAVAAPLVQAADIVVHFAAETHVDRSILDAGEFITTDVFGTFVLLEAARQAPGAAALRADLDRRGLRQRRRRGEPRGTSSRPRNPYSASKAGADRLALQLLGDLRRAGDHHARVEQLRARVSSPRRSCRCSSRTHIDDVPVPLYGDGLQRARLAARVATIAARSICCSDRGSGGRGLRRRRRQPRRATSI